MIQTKWTPAYWRKLMPTSMRDTLRHFRERERFKRSLRKSDIFLVGHPKSGNTWLAYMLAIALRPNGAQEITMGNLGDYVVHTHGIDSMVANYNQRIDPRLFRTEWPIFPELYPTTIYVVRNPLAVLVSYYHHYVAISGDDGMTLESFVKEYMERGCIRSWEPWLVRWDVQLHLWIGRIHRGQHVLLVRYEDMVCDRASVMSHVLQFAGASVSESDLARAVARGSFDAMRADEEKNGAEAYPGPARLRARFVRQGRTDGWKEEMDASLAGWIESEFAESMIAAGYV